MPSASYFWRKILNYIEETYSESVIITFFDDVDVVDMHDDLLVIYTPNPFRKPVLEQQGSLYIREAMERMYQRKISLLVLDDDGMEEYKNRGEKDVLSAITSEFTFEKFVVGPSNRFAHAAAFAVAARPAQCYNPLLIYGDSGLGKTHLLYAIANVIKKHHPSFKIVYCKGDDFTNEMISAIRDGKNVDFRNKYRNADLFLMDDIQFIAGKEQTQDEFFHTFNTLYESKKQIVLTSDRPPEEMNRLEERLKTRLQWGLLADIKPPDYETRVAIIHKKAAGQGMILPDDVVDYVAENITSNVRQLEGTINRIMAYRDMEKSELNLTNVSRAIKDMFKSKEKILPTAGLIISEVASYYNISESVIRGTQRDKKTAEARQVAMYMIRTLTTLSLEETAQEFGKDHTTVMHSVNKIEAAITPGSNLEATIKEISMNINGKL